MIIRNKWLEEFERRQLEKPSPGYLAQLRLFEAMFEEAKALGIFPLKDPLDGIEADIRLAKALNVQTTA